MANEGRASVIAAVSDWLKLLALVVLVTEGVIIIAMRMTPESNPLARWYPLFMLLFLVVVVVGVFVDRYLQTKLTRPSELTLSLGDKKVTVETSQMTTAPEEIKKYEIQTMYVDSQNGFMFPRPKLPLGSGPQYLNAGESLVKVGLLPNLDTWNVIKEAAALHPLGKMLVETKQVLFAYGDVIECQLTDETSTKVVDNLLKEVLNIAEKEREQLDDEFIRGLRKQLIQGSLTPERFKIQNSFVVSILDKNLAKGAPVKPNLGNVFLTQAKIIGSNVDRIVANDDSIMWGFSETLTNILVNGQLRELTIYSLNRLVESKDHLFQLTISFSPQSEDSLGVWDELKDMFNSFRMIV